MAENAIRRLRGALGLSMSELARRAGVSERTVWSAEHGRAVRPYTQRNLLRALRIPSETPRRDFFQRLPGHPRPACRAAREVELCSASS